MNIFKPYRFLPKEEIEHIALYFLNQVQAKKKHPLKAKYVAEAVADHLDIGIVWEDIPPDDEGDIAAMILPLQKEIIINKRIRGLEGGFGQSTIAHEIGHWLLHIDHNALALFKQRMTPEIKMTIEPYLCRRGNPQSQKRIEWQAQYFASCLLMPVYKLEEARRGRDLTNLSHLRAMANEFGVTTSNLKNRLKGLGWINYSQHSKQIYRGQAFPK